MSLNHFKDETLKICFQKGWENVSIPLLWMLITEEVGELASAIRRTTNNFTDKKKVYIEGEIMDVMSYLFQLADRFRLISTALGKSMSNPRITIGCTITSKMRIMYKEYLCWYYNDFECGFLQKHVQDFLNELMKEYPDIDKIKHEKLDSFKYKGNQMKRFLRRLLREPSDFTMYINERNEELFTSECKLIKDIGLDLVWPQATQKIKTSSGSIYRRCSSPHQHRKRNSS